MIVEPSAEDYAPEPPPAPRDHGAKRVPRTTHNLSPAANLNRHLADLYMVGGSCVEVPLVQRAEFGTRAEADPGAIELAWPERATVDAYGCCTDDTHLGSRPWAAVVLLFVTNRGGAEIALAAGDASPIQSPRAWCYAVKEKRGGVEFARARYLFSVPFVRAPSSGCPPKATRIERRRFARQFP